MALVEQAPQLDQIGSLSGALNLALAQVRVRLAQQEREVAWDQLSALHAMASIAGWQSAVVQVRALSPPPRSLLLSLVFPPPPLGQPATPVPADCHPAIEAIGMQRQQNYPRLTHDAFCASQRAPCCQRHVSGQRTKIRSGPTEGLVQLKPSPYPDALAPDVLSEVMQ